MKSNYIWMDGNLVEYEKANIHFNTVGLQYGIGVFEGIRCYSTQLCGGNIRDQQNGLNMFHEL